MSMLGADVVALRELSKKFSESARNLETLSSGLLRQVDVSTWEGPDADGFKDAWRSEHTPRLKLTASALTGAATALMKHAQEQETASDSAGATGRGPQHCEPGVTWFDKFIAGGTLAIRGLSFGLRALKTGRMVIPAAGFLSAIRLAAASRAASSAAVLMGSEMVSIVNQPGSLMAKLAPISKVIGPFGGAVALGAGIYQMINPKHDGWRGWGDRILGGGFGAIGGAATLALFTPLAVTPAGPVIAAVAVTAGVISAAWNLGNAIYDNWDTITAKTGAVCNAVVGGGKAAVGAIVDGAKAVGGVISRAAGAVGGFFKGIFG